MSSKAGRAEQMLKRLGDRVGMTEPGRNWVTLALDPFHDNPVHLDGYPDGNTSNSICQVIKQTMTITAPASVTTGTWDCSIVDWPHVQNSQLVPAATDQSITPPLNNLIYQVTPSSKSVSTGGITVYAGATGTQLSASYACANTILQGPTLTLPAMYSTGDHRIISKGFEVHNTSAQLYIGGSVICWRSPIPSIEGACNYQHVTYSAGTVSAINPATTHIYEGPPASAAAALKLPQSKQWDAKAGCYVVSALHNDCLPTVNGEPIATLLTDNTSSPSQALVSYIDLLASAVTGTNVYELKATKSSEFDLCGAFFTGLTPQTTLVVNWNVIVERFPSNDDLDLVVLANPSPELDDVAIKFYSHASRMLPTGVPVAMNGFGDWFKDVVSTASDYIAPVLSAIPHPAAQAIGMGLKVTNAAMGNRPAPQGAASSMSPYQSVSSASVIRNVASQEVKARNALVKAKNAAIRAKNEEIRARKANKGKKR
jgi:hypothetical protein